MTPLSNAPATSRPMSRSKHVRVESHTGASTRAFDQELLEEEVQLAREDLEIEAYPDMQKF
eukprot:CAMPEP_0170593134 /NCGR_PEP_ID=MMETSP0224-20130122/13286_1 /TAXON_ID=285029 /ORGANISM="Togula jolla, Strain CCCM 725" /LENGTH=60 /DNA_ID=CAMNT_0010917067 /DNA_START=718 /DNA_END=901 /DNA_ORIENTATION=-